MDLSITLTHWWSLVWWFAWWLKRCYRLNGRNVFSQSLKADTQEWVSASLPSPKACVLGLLLVHLPMSWQSLPLPDGPQSHNKSGTTLERAVGALSGTQTIPTQRKVANTRGGSRDTGDPGAGTRTQTGQPSPLALWPRSWTFFVCTS